jgi:hypothetical protein
MDTAESAQALIVAQGANRLGIQVETLTKEIADLKFQLREVNKKHDRQMHENGVLDSIIDKLIDKLAGM